LAGSFGLTAGASARREVTATKPRTSARRVRQSIMAGFLQGGCQRLLCLLWRIARRVARQNWRHLQTRHGRYPVMSRAYWQTIPFMRVKQGEDGTITPYLP